MTAKITFDEISQVKPVEHHQLLAKLATVKLRLSALFGAVLMFLWLGIIEPGIMETGPVPFIWFLLWSAPLVTGIYLLASPVWRTLPMAERRSAAIGGVAVGLLAFDYLPLLSFIVEGESGPFFVLTAMMGVILYWVYTWLGRPSKPSVSQDDLSLFP